VELLKNAKHVVVYTGAGVSTSAGIPDYRGPEGIWTKLDKGEKIGASPFLDEAHPSFGHFALLALLKAKYIHHIVSTNVDGLHLRSGVPLENISEIHGNIYKEVCEVCSKAYYRPFDILGRVKKRYTGRLCEMTGCNGKLKDSIINFGEYLSEIELGRATKESKNADLTIVLGTSLRVTSTSHLPGYSYKRGHPLIIVNLQKTPMDKDASLRIYGNVDYLLRLVTELLELEIPSYDKSVDMIQGQDITAVNVKIRNISSNVIESEIQNLLTLHGLVCTQYFLGEELNDKYCYITFNTPEEANKAVSTLDGLELKQKKIQVKLSLGKVDYEFEKKFSLTGLAMDDDQPPPKSMLNEILSFNMKSLRNTAKDPS